MTYFITAKAVPILSKCWRENLQMNHLSLEGDSLATRGGGASGGCLLLLDGDAATEGTGIAGVDQLDKAGVGLASDGAGALGTSGDFGLEGVVLVDVGGTLHDADRLQSASPSTLLGLLDVALGARDLSRDRHLGPCGASAVGVDHSGVWTSAVGRDNVHGAGDGAALGRDLRKHGAGLGHGLLGASLDVVVTGTLGAATAVGGVSLEDGGVRLSDLVLARAGDDTALDAESSAVAASVTSGDSDLAVGEDDRGGCESNEEDLGEHLDCCCGWFVAGRKGGDGDWILLI
jgi:hypothetical protein